MTEGRVEAACARCGVRERAVCGVLDARGLARLGPAAQRRRYRAGATLITEGERAQGLLTLTSGTAKLVKLLPDGRQQITRFVAPGQLLGLEAGARYGVGAQAIEAVTVCGVPRARLPALLRELPALEGRLLEAACEELGAAQAQMLLLGRKTAPERLASFLLAWSEQVGGEQVGGEDRIALPMTRGEIADHLGLTIETVSRTLSRFRRERRIATPRRHEVVILDRGWLMAVAEGIGPGSDRGS